MRTNLSYIHFAAQEAILHKIPSPRCQPKSDGGLNFTSQTSFRPGNVVVVAFVLFCSFAAGRFRGYHAFALARKGPSFILCRHATDFFHFRSSSPPLLFWLWLHTTASVPVGTCQPPQPAPPFNIWHKHVVFTFSLRSSSLSNPKRPKISNNFKLVV
jgi:hypothetical protein